MLLGSFPTSSMLTSILITAKEKVDVLSWIASHHVSLSDLPNGVKEAVHIRIVSFFFFFENLSRKLLTFHGELFAELSLNS